MAHPILVGLDLKPEGEALVRAWGMPHGLVTGDRIEPVRLSRDFTYLSGTDRGIRELLDWYLPVLVILGGDSPISRLEDVVRSGAAAVWRLPRAGSPVIFPPPVLPEVQSHTLLLTSDSGFRSRLRQLLRFAGSDARVDLRTPDEVAEAAASPDMRLVVIDLDDQTLDHHLLFHRLRMLARSRRVRVLVCKDFSRPGFDPRLFSAEIRPLTRRVFHPDEVPAVLAESFFLNGVRTGIPDRRAQSLDDFLVGEESHSPGRPGDTLDAVMPMLEELASVVPFLWTFDQARLSQRGAVLHAAEYHGRT